MLCREKSKSEARIAGVCQAAGGIIAGACVCILSLLTRRIYIVLAGDGFAAA